MLSAEEKSKIIEENTKDIIKDLIKDKNGYTYARFETGTKFTAFSLKRGEETLMLTGRIVLAFRFVEPSEIRTQDFTIMRYVSKVEHPNRFVETGTDKGATIELVREKFKEIYSIDIHKKRYERAKEKFKTCPHIHLIHGDSGKLLPQEADLYWLDAHEAPCVIGREITSKHTTGVCPLMDELRRIEKFEYILIDDATMMIGVAGFPSQSEIFEFVKNKWGIQCKVENEIIVIDKKNKQGRGTK